MSARERVLVIIEAVGKRQQLATTLGLTDENIFATKGHIRKHPPWPHVGVTSSFDEYGLLFDEYVADALRRTLMRVEPQEIIVATDDDTEGDVIARDTVELVGRVWRRSSECEFTRAKLRALDGMSVEKAFANRYPYEVRGVLAGDVRRVIDRVVPIAFRSSIKGTIGRVRSAVISAATASTVPTLVAHVVKRTDVGNLASLHAPVTKAQAEALRETFAGASLRTKDSPGLLVNTMDVLLASSELGCEPKQTMGALQRLYEQGLLSYPRTKSRALNDAAAKFAASISSVRQMPKSIDQSSELEGAHGAIVPVVNADFAMQQPLNGSNISEAVYRWVARRTCMAFDETPSLDLGSLDPSLRDLPWTMVNEATPLSGQRLTFEAVSPSLQVLGVLERLHVGRPSTFVQHADTVAQLGVFDDNGISEKGLRAQSDMPAAITGTQLCVRVDSLQNEEHSVSTSEVIKRELDAAFALMDVEKIRAALSRAQRAGAEEFVR